MIATLANRKPPLPLSGPLIGGLDSVTGTTADILRERPDWELFRDGCPGGESTQQIGERADRVVSRLRAVPGDALVFSSGHFIRVFAARWLGLEASAPGRHFALNTASLSAVGYEHNLSRPVIRLWNDDRHVVP
jgi:probable phosphoglycerate mutase